MSAMLVYKLLATFALALALASFAAPELLRRLRVLKFGQHAYEDAPKTHQKKTGTPTMGGLLFLAGPLVATCFSPDRIALGFDVLVVGMTAIGFADDYLSIKRGRNLGLRGPLKFALTALVGAAFLALVATPDVLARGIFPFGVAPLWFWAAFSLLVILATSHAVNLTDGLDGLAGGTALPAIAALLCITIMRGGASGAAPYVEVGLLGAIVAFLRYNRHPARVFMGDTGSLALGGAIAGAAIVSGSQLLLPLIGGVFVAEALSVIVQVASYKTTKRRVFRMSPLHHHFELGGWPETKVTARFTAAAIVLGVAGLTIAVIAG
jgi:phospho-N-acetylmuramoyl-pentapeptide-transferase